MPYSVPTTNRFAQLDSDVEEEPVVVKKETAAPPAHAKQQRREPREGGLERRPFDQREAGRGGRGGRGGRTDLRDMREVREPREPRAEPRSPQNNWDDEAVVDGDRSAIRGRRRFGDSSRGGFEGGRGAGFPSRGGRGGPFRGREFDRRSGTGRGREMKKSGAGAHNWGTEPTEEVIEGVPTEMEPTISTATGVEEISSPQLSEEEKKAAEEEAAAAAAAAAAEAEEAKIIDFAEWQRDMKAKRAALLQEKNDAPTRVVDAADLEKDGYARYEREETAEERALRELRLTKDEDVGSDEDDAAGRPRTINIYEFTGEYGRRGGRGGRGGRGRGGDRGERGERGERFPRPRTPPRIEVSIHDNTAFPCLI